MPIDYPRLEEVLALHAEIKGVPVATARDHVHRMDLLESALARPQNAAQYGSADLVDQAATLLWGLVRNHPFMDGNKRTAYVVTRLFLQLNGLDVEMSEVAKFDLVIEIANGGLAVDETAATLREHLRARSDRVSETRRRYRRAR